MGSHFIKIYFIFAIFFSLWLYRYSVNVVYYWILVLVTVMFLMGISLLMDGLQKAPWVDKMKRLFIVAFIILFISLGFLYSFVSGLDERFCYNLLAQNTITRRVNNYCNFPPWYTKILRRTNFTRNLPTKLPDYAGFQGDVNIK
jgi:hypothetical protein